MDLILWGQEHFMIKQHLSKDLIPEPMEINQSENVESFCFTLHPLIDIGMNGDFSPRNMWEQHDKSSSWRSSYGPLTSPSSGPATCHSLHHVDCYYSLVATMGLRQESGETHN